MIVLYRNAKKEAYRQLIDVCFEYCDRFELVIRQDLGETEMIESFLPFIESALVEMNESYEWAGTILDEEEGVPAKVYHYHTRDEKVKEILKETVSSLYDWQSENDVPEDLSFFKGNEGWLISTAHERQCSIYPANELEKERILSILGLIAKEEDEESFELAEQPLITFYSNIEGDGYQELMDLCFSHCDSFKFSVDESLVNPHLFDTFIDAFSDAFIEKKEEQEMVWPPSENERLMAYHFYTTEEARERIKLSADSLYSWELPDLPERLTFYKGEDIWLTSDALERKTHVYYNTEREKESIVAIDGFEGYVFSGEFEE